MSKINILLYKSDFMGRLYKITLYKPLLLLLFLLYITIIASTIIFFILSSYVKKDIEIIKAYEPSFDMEISQALPYINSLNKATIRIGDSDSYIFSLSDLPVLKDYKSASLLRSSYLDYEKLIDLLHYDSKNVVDTSHLKRFSDVVSREYEKRLTEYGNMLSYLEEIHILYTHTPHLWPTTKRITSNFGFRKSPFTGEPSFHEGTDFGALVGTPCFATADGVVVFAGVKGGYGNLVTVDHGYGYMTRYAHNSKLLVKAGDFVKRGDQISLTGATGQSAGPHLHYEVLYNGTPINSAKFLPPIN